MSWLGLNAEPLTNPDPTKTYLIQHSSGLFMTRDGNSATIMSVGAGDCQKVKFEIAETDDAGVVNYYIKFEDGKYLGSDKGYTVTFHDEASEMTQYTFWESTEPDHVIMWNVGRGAYFGTDKNSEGSGIYSDKGGNDGKHAWKFIEASDGLIVNQLENSIASAKSFIENNPVDNLFTQEAKTAITAAMNEAESVLSSAKTQAEINDAASTLNTLMNAANNLLTALRNAQKQYDNAEIGNIIGGYPQAAADALNQTITTSITQWNTSDPAIYTATASDLNAAIAAFNNAHVVFIPTEGKQYYFFNTYNNLMLGVNSNGEAALAIPSGEISQRFTISQVKDLNVAFNIARADGEGYLAVKGGWNSTTLSDPNNNDAKIFFELIDAKDKIYTLNRYNFDGHWASDGNNPGDLVYTNKWGNANDKWQIIEVNEGELLTIALETAIANAKNYLDKAVVGEQPGNYPQTAIDALRSALATAEGGNYTNQEAVNEAVAALNAAINAFLGEKIDPFFIPEPNTAYRYSVRKYHNKYMTANAEKTGTSDFEANKAEQHWTLIPVEDAKYTYILKNGNLTLNYDGTMTENNDADAQKWTVVYTVTADNLPYFALVEYDNPSKVLTFGSGTNWSIQDFDKGNNAHQGRFMRVDAANDPYVFELERAIANARNTLENINRGNEIGKWSDAKCEAFELVINEADALRGLTQEEVDAKVAEINKARTDFINNPNAVIKDKLEAAIEAAKAKAAAAEIGIHIGQYLESAIESFEADIRSFEAQADKVTEQEACDTLTEEVTKATEEFAGHSEEQPVKTVLDDAIICAETLYENEKDNVGDDLGQRPQECLDAFKAAIDKAKSITTPTENDLLALLDARQAFLEGAVSTNRTPIREAIAKAEGNEFSSLTAGEYDGNYPQENIDAFTKALADAKTAESDRSKTQKELDDATKALNDAMTTLRNSVVKINFTDLDQTISKAENAIASVTKIGDGEGECPQATVDALKETLDKAKNADRKAISQSEVDEISNELAEATAKFNTELVASTGISEAINNAQAILDSAVQGFKPGNYPVTAMTSLREAIEAALLVSLNTEATQEELLNAVATLKTAVESFKTQVIPAHDLTELNSLISKAEEFIAATGSEDFILTTALTAAKEIAGNPDNYTASQVKKATSDLKKALQVAGIAEAKEDCVEIHTAEGIVRISGLAGYENVAIYTLDGKIIFTAPVSAENVEANTGAGKFAIVVNGNGKKISKIVIVK